MTRIKGIGGIFIKSDDADKLARWYTEVLGVRMERHPEEGKGWFYVFETRDVEDASLLRENPVFAIMPAASKLPPPDQRSYSLGLRVDDRDALLIELRNKGVEIEKETFEWERGKHAWIRDPDGNRIDLYEEILTI